MPPKEPLQLPSLCVRGNGGVCQQATCWICHPPRPCDGQPSQHGSDVMMILLSKLETISLLAPSLPWSLSRTAFPLLRLRGPTAFSEKCSCPHLLYALRQSLRSRRPSQVWIHVTKKWITENAAELWDGQFWLMRGLDVLLKDPGVLCA